MELRQLGRTDLKVSVIGMGGIPVQRVSTPQAAEVIKTAILEGINFFDSARAYSDSEDKMGQALAGCRKQVIIATKSMARSREDMAIDIEFSLQSLRTDYIDIYQLHNVKDEGTLEIVLSGRGALTALKKAREQGKVRYIGITGHIPAVLVKAVRTGEFDTVQFPLNPLEAEGTRELVPLAREMNLGTIAMKPFAGGAIRNRVSALKFILEQGVSSAIPGMDEIRQVHENAGAGKKGALLTETEKRALFEEVASLDGNLCRRCEYCRPCPKGIDIPLIFLLDGYWTRYGLQEWAADRYKPLGVKASECAGCGECEIKCPYGLPIRNMLSEAARHLEKQ